MVVPPTALLGAIEEFSCEVRPFHSLSTLWPESNWGSSGLLITAAPSNITCHRFQFNANFLCIFTWNFNWEFVCEFVKVTQKIPLNLEQWSSDLKNVCDIDFAGVAPAWKSSQSRKMAFLQVGKLVVGTLKATLAG